MLLSLVFSVMVILTSECLANILPSYIPRCFINDPNLNNCILNATNALRSHVRRGMDELGVPSFYPLVVSFDMVQESDMMNYTAGLRNFSIRGMDNYDITEIQYDPDKNLFRGKLELNPLSINSMYTIDGRMLFFPVRGTGNMQLAIGPINGTFEIVGSMSKYKGVDYFDATNFTIQLSIEDLSAYLDGLFDGDLEKAAMTNELISRNSKMIVEAGTPVIERISEKFILRYLKWLTRTYPFHDLFPHS